MPARIWVGTDDGLVQLTRDGGKTWSNVTPPDVGEAMVNIIEVSPHDAATAYVAVDRVQVQRLHAATSSRPPTTARRWTTIVEGIAPRRGPRVVREDPVRKDLLYPGTETGFYVSFNGGAALDAAPAQPAGDADHRSQGPPDDLVASTAGRAFWILDDLSPLQQWTDATAATDVRLFKPRRGVSHPGVRRRLRWPRPAGRPQRAERRGD